MDREVEDIISILQNAEKMKELILKLKTIGKNSPRFQNFKNCMDLFHLNRPPRGVHEKNILQTVFKFSAPRECFNSFRMVSKSWQNAVETIRLDDPNEIGLISELCDFEKNGRFPKFYEKYIKIFRNFYLYFDPDFDMSKWHPVSKILSSNLTKLNRLEICGTFLPKKFHFCLFSILQKSQFTLQTLVLNSSEIACLPAISLPNLSTISFGNCLVYNSCLQCYLAQDEQIDAFDYLMKSFVNSDVLCKNLKTFLFLETFFFHYWVSERPKILKYIAQNYSSHFVYAPVISILEHIPLKIAYLYSMENLASYRYISQIEYLSVGITVSLMSLSDWDKFFNEIFTFCPNLKGITFKYGGTYLNFESFVSRTTSKIIRDFWEQKISDFKSKNIQILHGSEFLEIQDKLCKSSTESWIFTFKV